MSLVAITGSLCTGKSFVLSIFAERGIPTFDSDQEIRKILKENTGVIQEIAKKYPHVITSGVIDREKLGKVVFHDKSKLKELEAWLYPILSEKRQEFIERNRKSPILAIEVPLLYEKNLEANYDIVITTDASKDTNRKRAESRGMKSEAIKAILSHQLPDQLKKAKADYIINTDGNKAEVRKNVDSVIKDIRGNV